MVTPNTDDLTIQELSAFLNEIELLAPAREETEGSLVSYRLIESDEIIDDTLQPEVAIEDLVPSSELPEDIPLVNDFQIVQGGPVVAIDCGIVRLGETENGLVIALRATIVIDRLGDSKIHVFRTGPLYLHNRHRLEILYEMGRQLGKPDQFVEIDNSDPANPHPLRVKSGVAHDAHKYGDRFRNWFERLVQKIAINQIDNGIVLLDGALTLRTIDTPDIYFDRLGLMASSKGNSLIAISKQSLLQVKDRPIRFWLSDSPNKPCYRRLTSLMRQEDNERVFGSTYSARFSHLGPTFRMDVKPIDGQSEDEAINKLFSSTLMRGGYPDILVRAHAHSYFTSPDVIQLQAQAGTRYSLIPQADVDLSAIFGPFGGRFK
jgi:hypothetical protein